MALLLALCCLTWVTCGAVVAYESGLPPRPLEVPAETPVADLGANEVLPERLLAVLQANPQPNPLSNPEPLPLATGTLPLPPPPPPLPLLPLGDTLVLAYPLAVPATELDPYGWRYSETRGRWRMHAGVDLIVPAESAVLAALPGTTRLVDDVSGYGLTVVIDHGDGWLTLYAHLLDVAVVPGQRVNSGERIGRVGQTGRATTPHLHFELRRQLGGRTVAMDPWPVIAQPLLAGAAAANR
ncbi:M23 family metallopeptidase [Synechococcus sp. ATX 2A4]|uniref:M23 family metallopeptidase n=1 Tax=Synechococcus sp. ATX 2A4 TaxID=2823727 RepID=UPI0020CE6B7B|nr:M23 family metallopeptidase [Synechococcus sp. ATX 2A4]